MKLVFNMTWLMEILRIYLEEQQWMKYCVINKVFDIAKNPKYDGHQRGLASMVYKVFDEKSTWLADKSASKTIKGTGISSKIKQ